MVKALADHPAMRMVFLPVDGAPHRRALEVVNLGLAVDVARRDGSRALVVPAVKGAQALSFDRFFAAANDLIRRAQRGQLGPDDFQDVTVQPHQPGDAGHHPLGGAADGRAELHPGGREPSPGRPSTSRPTSAPWRGWGSARS